MNNSSYGGGFSGAFQMARDLGNERSASNRRRSDENNIERILQEASQGGPEQLQGAIGQILSTVSPERQGSAIKYLEQAYNNVVQKQQQAKQNQAISDIGGNPDLPANLQLEDFKNRNKGKRLDEANSIFDNIGGNSRGNASVSQPNQPTAQNQPNQNIPNNGQPNQPPESSPNQDMENAKQQLLRLTGSEDRETAERAKAMLKEIENQEKTIQKGNIASRKEQLEFHKESEDYDKELFKGEKTAKLQIDTINDVEKALKSGNIKSSSLASLFKGFGTVGDKISNALLNEDQSTLLASIPAFLEGRKELFGVRLSDADLKLLQDKLPDISKSVESNKTILKLMKKYAKSSLLRSKIGNKIKEENKGLRPLGYANKVEQRYDEMIKPVRIVNPNNGRIIEIPAYEVGDAINAGAKLADDE